MAPLLFEQIGHMHRTDRTQQADRERRSNDADTQRKKRQDLKNYSIHKFLSMLLLYSQLGIDPFANF